MPVSSGTAPAPHIPAKAGTTPEESLLVSSYLFHCHSLYAPGSHSSGHSGHHLQPTCELRSTSPCRSLSALSEQKLRPGSPAKHQSLCPISLPFTPRPCESSAKHYSLLVSSAPIPLPAKATAQARIPVTPPATRAPREVCPSFLPITFHHAWTLTHAGQARISSRAPKVKETIYTLSLSALSKL